MNNRAVNFLVFGILALLWLAFGAALLFSPASLDGLWQTFLGWPLLLKLVVGLLVLPLALGLWVWELPWPLLVRLLIVAGLAWFTIYSFFPRKAAAAAAPAPVRP